MSAPTDEPTDDKTSTRTNPSDSNPSSSNPSVSNPSVFATLQAHDAPALIDYYVRALGFVLVARYDDGDLVAHAQLNWPEGRGALMIGSHASGGEWAREPGSAGVYLVTSDPAAIAARVSAAIPELGGEIVRPLAATDHGGRELTVRDPEGNLFSCGDYPGA